jgi:hypothetical protein
MPKSFKWSLSFMYLSLFLCLTLSNLLTVLNHTNSCICYLHSQQADTLQTRNKDDSTDYMTSKPELVGKAANPRQINDNNYDDS